VDAKRIGDEQCSSEDHQSRERQNRALRELAVELDWWLESQLPSL
jgi:hypothetical protein